MKRLLFSMILSMGLFAAAYAQTAAPATAQATAKVAKKASGTTKSGKPDMRFKANKEAAKAGEQQPVAPVATRSEPAAPVSPKAKSVTTTPAVAPNPVPAQHTTTAVTRNVQPVKTATTTGSDAVAGTDAKGRTLYRGKRGGVYYINKNGNKEYVKQQ